MVYLIREEVFEWEEQGFWLIKTGGSVRGGDSRAIDMQTGNPRRLIVIWEKMTQNERVSEARLKDFIVLLGERIRGEWYKVDIDRVKGSYKVLDAIFGASQQLSSITPPKPQVKQNGGAKNRTFKEVRELSLERKAMLMQKGMKYPPKGYLQKQGDLSNLEPDICRVVMELKENTTFTYEESAKKLGIPSGRIGHILKRRRDVITPIGLCPMQITDLIDRIAKRTKKWEAKEKTKRTKRKKQTYRTILGKKPSLIPYIEQFYLNNKDQTTIAAMVERIGMPYMRFYSIIHK